ncbi:hypothetical protein KIH75_09445, partial [Bifidobacterium sp. 64T4]|uniref:hypothetical protein n=1 Tax=Bifidobacterium pongonis TaxID=2834432 RepID=UPI001C599A83
VPSPGFQSRFFVLANENRTQDAGHALLRQGRNPKVRKISDVILVLSDFGNGRVRGRVVGLSHYQNRTELG